MAEVVGGVLYGIKNLAEGAALLAKGIYDPTLPLKATLQPITSIQVPLTQHSVSVVKGRAYLFGGKTSNNNDAGNALADSDVHIVILPVAGSSGSVDYKKIPASSAAPPKRYGHSAAVLEDRIYVFGGNGEDGAPLDEGGRVWVFNTASNSWYTLDPPESSSSRPDPRAFHASVTSGHPRLAPPKPRDDILPQQPPDPEETLPEIPDADTYGTVIIQGGQATSGQNHLDAWSFDLSSRTWKELPSVPSPSSPSSSLALVDERLYAFSAGQTSYLDFDYAKFNDAYGTGELGLEPLRPWQSLPPPSAGSSPETGYPGERSHAALIPITTGQGRNYLLLLGGKSHAGEVLQDVWTLQLQPEAGSAASWKDAARSAINKDTSEARWEEVKYLNAEGVMIQEGQEGRGIGAREGFAAAKACDVDGQTLLLWGGVGADGKVRGDGMMVTIDV